MNGEELSKNIVKKGKDWAKEITREDREWAIELATKSGLPGTMKNDGPGDAFRHIIGTALITKRLGYLAALIGTVMSEYDGYQDSLKKDGERTARGRLWMDVRNNVWGVILWMRYGELRKVGSVTIAMLERGPDDNFVRWQREGFSESGISVDDSLGTGGEVAGVQEASGRPGSTASKPSSSSSGPKASWFDSPENNDFLDKQEWKDIITDAIIAKVTVDDERDGKTVWPVTKDERTVADEALREIPTTAEELRELFIELGITSTDWSALELLFSPDIPEGLKIEELAREAPRNELVNAIFFVLALPDTSNELKSSLLEWLRKHSRFSLDDALAAPEVSDPPKDLRFGKDK